MPAREYRDPYLRNPEHPVRDWGTLKVGPEVESRPSAADEQAFADQEQERRDAERRAEEATHRVEIRTKNAQLGQNVQEALLAVGRLANGLERVDGRTRKDLQQVRSLLRRIRERHTAPE
jgi:hypothetical protein